MREHISNTRSSLTNTIKTFATQTLTFRATVFPFCTKEWNQLSHDSKKIESIKKFKKTLITTIRTKENSAFGVSNIYGIKLLTRLRLNFSHLNEHKFRHNFNDMINPMCNCGAATKTTIHYLLRCRYFSFQRMELLDGIYKLDSTLQNFSEDQLLTVLLYDSKKIVLNVNKEIVRLTISYLKASQQLYLFIFLLIFFDNV